jgi:hypothetical protein
MVRLLVLLVSLALSVGWWAPARPIQAQDCQQPVATGCTLDPDSPVEATLDAGDAHLWLLSVAAGDEIHLTLMNPRTDLRLYAYGPDGELFGVSDSVGFDDEVLDIAEAPPGRYQVFVDSPQGEATDGPYQLMAALMAGGRDTTAGGPEVPSANQDPVTARPPEPAANPATNPPAAQRPPAAGSELARPVVLAAAPDPTEVPTPSPTRTPVIYTPWPTPTPTLSPTPAPTRTPAPTATPSPTPQPIPTTGTRTPTRTPTPTALPLGPFNPPDCFGIRCFLEFP